MLHETHQSGGSLGFGIDLRQRFAFLVRLIFLQRFDLLLVFSELFLPHFFVFALFVFDFLEDVVVAVVAQFFAQGGEAHFQISYARAALFVLALRLGVIFRAGQQKRFHSMGHYLNRLAFCCCTKNAHLIRTKNHFVDLIFFDSECHRHLMDL